MVKHPRKLLPVAALALSSSLVLLTNAFIHSKIEHHRLASEHLKRARAACGYEGRCADPEGAMEQLRAIPEDAPEQLEVLKIQLRIENQRLTEENQRPREMKRPSPGYQFPLE